MSDQSLELRPQQSVAKHEDNPLSARNVLVMLKGAIDHGITTENASAVEKIVGLLERVEASDAKKDFISALKAFQAEAKSIKATKAVENSEQKGGGVRFKYAPFEEIMDSVQPMADRYGFVISFSEDKSDPGKITKVCELMHGSGHSKSSRYSVRIGKGPPGCSETQADGAAHAYAKRGALCDILNIRIDKGLDNDARDLGAFISKEQADALRKRVRDTGSNEAMFLKFAQARTFEEIHESMYAALDANLRRKEKP